MIAFPMVKFISQKLGFPKKTPVAWHLAVGDTSLNPRDSTDSGFGLRVQGTTLQTSDVSSEMYS